MHGVTEVCPECQFDPSVELDPVERFSTFAKRFPIPITRLLPTDPPDILRTRLQETTWSALEYVGHVKGVCTTTTDWINATVSADVPVLTAPDPDAEVAAGGFNDMAPAELAEQARSAATTTSQTLAAVGAGALDRTATFAGMTVPLRLLVIAMIHECHHHLLDIGRVLRTVRTQSAALPHRRDAPA